MRKIWRRADIRPKVLSFIASVVDIGNKLMVGVIVIGEKLIAGVMESMKIRNKA
jgi:hypothetical protein